ncbi:hypothetical protein DAEQUDRAFT_516434 [Daedalea quercina L-15889]|uniref:CHCH domain-containing protein n=1 Tax=Daedalea quercina L-15889 TaxID=1314783 RepID=A0A165MFV4_9APHY|nr:hypothetical protein DAEQUDRAFT_516434 [Daedalea quercina L-15889]
MAKPAAPSKTGQDDLPHPMENVTPDDYKKSFEGRVKTKFVDPCDRASKASMECMNRNDFDRAQCSDFFQAYRDCKKDWVHASSTNSRQIDVRGEPRKHDF